MLNAVYIEKNSLIIILYINDWFIVWFLKMKNYIYIPKLLNFQNTKKKLKKSGRPH